MNTLDTLLAYSEWLDGEKINPSDSEDERTHEDLVKQFIAHWDENPERARLADAAQANLGMATTYDIITELAARADVADTIGEDWPRYRTVDS
jgi:hypothetical protein